jgi:hypothetical protein
MAGCRISASALKNTVDERDPSFCTPKLKFNLCIFINLARLTGELVIQTHDIPLCRQCIVSITVRAQHNYFTGKWSIYFPLYCGNQDTAFLII